MTTSPLDDRTSTAFPAPPPATPETWDNPRTGFLFVLGFAAIGAAMANLVPLVLTLSLKATVIDPQNATSVLSIAVAVGSVFALVAFPALGRLSDRTTSRLGRRRPFLLAGALLMVVGAVVLAVAASTPVLALGAVLTAVGFSASMMVCTAVIPDQFAPDRRGPAAALVGLSLPLGAVTGLFIAQLLAPNLVLMILVPAAIGALGSLALVAVLRDRRITAAERPVFDWRQFLTTFWVSPRQSPNYAWAWWSRMLVFLGVAAVQAYQAFYLIVVLAFSPAEVAGAVFLSTLVLTAVALLFAPLAGKLSDVVGRRKPFVIGAALIFGVGLALASVAQTFPAFLVAMGVIGLGQGVYFAVDIALVTLVLPDPANPAKDLGIMNLANSLPPAIVPAIAPLVLGLGATAAQPQNFTALFLFGAIAGLLGALLILPIRGVR